MRPIRRHLSYANVMVTILAFVVFGGGSAVALTGSDTVQSDDLGPGAQVQAADVAANAVNGADVVDNSLTAADIAPSALSKGRAINSSCNPTDATFVVCGAVTINLAQSSRVLIVTSAMWSVDGDGSAGTCRLRVDGVPFGSSAFPGEALDTSGAFSQQSVALTNVAGPLAAGSHTLGLACNQRRGDIVFDPTYVSAVVLGSG
jgi:hypothetical protein